MDISVKEERRVCVAPTLDLKLMCLDFETQLLDDGFLVMPYKDKRLIEELTNTHVVVDNVRYLLIQYKDIVDSMGVGYQKNTNTRARLVMLDYNLKRV